jgi:hypothetical protein
MQPTGRNAVTLGQYGRGLWRNKDQSCGREIFEPPLLLFGPALWPARMAFEGGYRRQKSVNNRGLQIHVVVSFVQAVEIKQYFLTLDFIPTEITLAGKML